METGDDKKLRDFLLDQSGLRNLTLTHVLKRLDCVDSESILTGYENYYDVGGFMTFKDGGIIRISYSGRGPCVEKNKTNKKPIKKKVETNNWSSTKKLIRQKTKASKKVSEKIR